MTISAHLGASRTFIIPTPGYLGCKGSWVQIPPRRPFISNTYTKNVDRGRSLVFPNFTWGDSLALGANSAHRKSSRRSPILTVRGNFKTSSSTQWSASSGENSIENNLAEALVACRRASGFKPRPANSLQLRGSAQALEPSPPSNSTHFTMQTTGQGDTRGTP